MLLSKYLNPFIVYNLLLVFLFSLSINEIESFSIINSVSYIFLQYVIIYLGLYYYCKKLYIVFFLYGLGIDLFLIDQIGTHLLVFMILLIFFNYIKKYLKNFNSQKVYLVILIVLITIIFLEMQITQLFFGYNFYWYVYLKLFFISVLISYPIFWIFSKIDNIN